MRNREERKIIDRWQLKYNATAVPGRDSLQRQKPHLNTSKTGIFSERP
jgi:hypothetical protein